MKVFENFFTNIQLPKCKGNGLKVNQRQRKIVGLLSWLKTTNLNDAISTVLCNLKKKKRDYAKSVIEHAVDSYKVPKCNLTFILDDRLADLKSELKLNSKLTRPCGEVLPASFIIRFLCGCYPSFFLNAISLHRTFLPSQVENVNLDSSFACSLYIRQVLYGILLRHDVPSSECENKECLSCVEEYDRRNGSLQKESVEPIFTLRSGTVLPNLYTLKDLSKVQSEKILSEVLGNEVGIFSSVPSEWQLLLGCIKYWLKNSNPGPKEEFIYALAISMLYFSFLTKFSCNDNKNDFDAKQEESDFSSISSTVKLVSDSEIDTAKRNIKKYLQKPVFNNGNPIILHIVHSFSQLQT
ncbi:Protein asteroid-like protein, partial [Stegodyphus mimosarum]